MAVKECKQVSAIVVDADTLRFGGSAFVRERTCRLEGFADVQFNVDYEVEGYDASSGTDYAGLAECSECNALVIVPPEYRRALTCDGDELWPVYSFCPNCGAKVVEHD